MEIFPFLHFGTTEKEQQNHFTEHHQFLTSMSQQFIMKFGISSQSFKKTLKFVHFRVKTPDPVHRGKWPCTAHRHRNTFHQNGATRSVLVEAGRGFHTETGARHRGRHLLAEPAERKITADLPHVLDPKPRTFPAHTLTPTSAEIITVGGWRARPAEVEMQASGSRTRGTSALRGRRRACDLWLGREGNAVVS